MNILLLLLLLLLLLSPARARIPEPDNILYGSIALDGQLVTASRTDVVVEARRTQNGPAIARYRMGTDPELGNFYALTLALESLPPVGSANASQTGQQVFIVVLDASNAPFATNSFTIGERGTVQRMDIGVLTGFDAWAQANGLPAGSGNVDSDGDALSNMDEYIAGTNPRDPNSKFALAITDQGVAVEVSFLAVRAEGAGYEGRSRYYSLSQNTNRLLDSWAGVPNYTNRLGNNQPIIYTEPATNSPRFYRARVRLEP